MNDSRERAAAGPGGEPVAAGPRGAIRAVAVAFSLTVAFVVAVALVRAWRPNVIFGPDRTWWRLWLAIATLSAAAVCASGWAANAFFRRFSASGLARAELLPLPFSRRTLLLVATASIVLGALLRAAWLVDPPPLFGDEVSLISPTLALEGSPRDFVPAHRPVPFGVERPWGSVGVAYLEAFRAALRLFGVDPAGLRVLSVLGGVASLVTATLLARALLPTGGAALAALALAGLRWHLILSSWGWVAIVLAPLLDLAAWLLVRGRARGSAPREAAAGALAGIGAHVYLAGWIGFASLLLWRLWPLADGEPARRRARGAALFSAAFAVTVLPLFLLARADDPPYFARVGSHNLLREFRIRRSVAPLFEATADALASPWFVPEPAGWADLPGRSRLGPVLGLLVAIAFGRAALRPREALSAYLLAQAGGALAASVAQGSCGSPNGYRFVYLTSPTAVAVAAGALAVVTALPLGAKRARALAVLGLVAVSGAVGLRDALVRWPVSRFRFEGFRAGETLVAESAERWRAYGSVTTETMGDSVLVRALSTVDLFHGPVPAARSARAFRIASPGGGRKPSERLVEVVRDPWGRPVAEVFGRPAPGP